MRETAVKHPAPARCLILPNIPSQITIALQEQELVVALRLPHQPAVELALAILVAVVHVFKQDQIFQRLAVATDILMKIRAAIHVVQFVPQAPTPVRA